MYKRHGMLGVYYSLFPEPWRAYQSPCVHTAVENAATFRPIMQPDRLISCRFSIDMRYVTRYGVA
jgi:hypothetical protein